MKSPVTSRIDQLVAAIFAPASSQPWVTYSVGWAALSVYFVIDLTYPTDPMTASRAFALIPFVIGLYGLWIPPAVTDSQLHFAGVAGVVLGTTLAAGVFFMDPYAVPESLSEFTLGWSLIAGGMYTSMWALFGSMFAIVADTILGWYYEWRHPTEEFDL